MSPRRRIGWEDELLRVVTEHPGSTYPEVCRHARFGKGTVPVHLVMLVRRGVLRRKGRGGPGDPFRYYPVEEPA